MHGFTVLDKYALPWLDEGTTREIIGAIQKGYQRPIFTDNAPAGSGSKSHLVHSDGKRRIVKLTENFWIREGPRTNKACIYYLFPHVAASLSKAFGQDINPTQVLIGILSKKRLKNQVAHFDLGRNDLINSRKLQGPPQYAFSMLLPLDSRYQLDVWPGCFGCTRKKRKTTSVRITLNAGSIVILRQDFIHAGTNIPDTFRLFDYLDNDKIEREANTRGVVLDSLMKSHYIRDSNPKPISALALLSKLDQ